MRVFQQMSNRYSSLAGNAVECTSIFPADGFVALALALALSVSIHVAQLASYVRQYERALA